MPVSDTVARDDTDAKDDRLPVDELFASLQGGGKLAGIPNTFVRTSGYNLRYWFCNSFHTSWKPTHAWLSLDEIVVEVRSLSPEHVIVTGGESLVHNEADALLSALDDDYHLTVETNGALETDAPTGLANINPELASSTPTSDSVPDDIDPGVWTERHKSARVDPGALASLVKGAAKLQLKFVVAGRDNLDEIESFVDDVRGVVNREIRDSGVLLVPEGQTHEQLARIRTEVAGLTASFGYHYTPQLHVDLWNGAPKT